MSSVADAWPECLGAERRVDRSDGDVAWANASAHPLSDAGAKSEVADSEMRSAPLALRFAPLYLGNSADPRNGLNRPIRSAPENVNRPSFVTID